MSDQTTEVKPAQAEPVDQITIKSSDIKKSEREYLTPSNKFLFFTCLGLGLLANLLFFGKGLGISYPIFLACFYTVFCISVKKKKPLGINLHTLLLITIALLSLVYALFSNPVFLVLNFPAIPVLVVIQTTLWSGTHKYPYHYFEFIQDFILSSIVKPFTDIMSPIIIFTKLISQKLNMKKNENLIKVLIGLGISSAILLIIIPTLISADSVFKSYMGMLPQIFTRLDLGFIIGRIIFLLIFMCFSFSFIYNSNKDNIKPIQEFSGESFLSKRFTDQVISITVLFTINLIYIFFCILQFTYLFGGMVPTGSTYSEYARSGFFELSFITVFNLGIILFDISFTKTTVNVLNIFSKVLRTILVFCTMIMDFSAFFRMMLYENSYGYTYLRVFTHLFMIFIFVLLTTTLIKIWVDGLQLAKIYIFISLAAWLFINYAGVDNFIAARNIERYHNADSFDAIYLTDLSDDAVPALIPLLKDKDAFVSSRIRENLNERLTRLTLYNDWQSFNLSAHNAKVLLKDALKD